MFKEAGFYFDEHFTIWGDDWDYGMRLLQAGANIYFDPRIFSRAFACPIRWAERQRENLECRIRKAKTLFLFL